MLLTLFASAALLMPASPAAADHGKLPWFEGTFAEALAEAKASNKIIFLDFWADW